LSDGSVPSEDEAHDVMSNKNDAVDEIEPSWSVLLIQHFLSLLSGRLNDCYLNGQVLPFFLMSVIQVLVIAMSLSLSYAI
jgi:hypothetical protein